MKPARRAGRAAGFTLIELLIAVAIIGIVAAIAVPALGRARAAALESSAVGLLRAINSGQAAYAATCAQGQYAPSLLWLTRAREDTGPVHQSRAHDKHRAAWWLSLSVPAGQVSWHGGAG
jgi:prepilin-type N-terminal cleavage/methylation domain-containing protein